ncbi:hypothetical protein SCP_1100010 [Sparassis crispa]|uniref:Uncharacterized protein n=1 Tax=Sparassis crispa TaxID=139825 RepID=A0A401GYT2_9APHY|nr:hypothetical protein SCP_1100010 [Sparassis crispa]GBE87326.1 hypothetical protein SCP_1100010 [Sparassis crispa]
MDIEYNDNWHTASALSSPTLTPLSELSDLLADALEEDPSLSILSPHKSLQDPSGSQSHTQQLPNPFSSQPDTDLITPSLAPAILSPTSSAPCSMIDHQCTESNSSDSSADLLAYTHPIQSKMDSTKTGHLIASVMQHSIKQAPTVSTGKLTPSVLLQWESACIQYFKKKSVPDDEKVSHVTGGFMDELVHDWYLSDSDTIDALKWPNFVSLLRKRWLDKNWEDAALHQLIHLRQCDDEPFKDWIVSLEKQNTLLCDSPLRMDTATLRAHISANACEEIHLECNKPVYCSLSDFKDWKDAITAFDNDRLMDHARRLHELDHYLCSNCSSAPSSSSLANCPAFASKTAPPGTDSKLRAVLPKLTDSDHALYDKYEGCYKCRCFFVKCKKNNCLNDFPDAATYQPLTAAAGFAA